MFLRSFGVAALCTAVVVAFVVAHFVPAGAGAGTSAAPPGPTSGYTLHIDASQHYAGHPEEIIHHWCKKDSASFIECLLFDGDGPSAHMVGVETIVPTAVWKTYDPTEQRLWHYHRVEIPKLKYAKMPGLSKAEADKVMASILETYGKVWILWDPMTTNGRPTGQPTITILK